MKWVYQFHVVDIANQAGFFSREAADIRNVNVDLIKKFGDDGWELVAVTPIIKNAPTENGIGGTTSQILFTFKKPQE